MWALGTMRPATSTSRLAAAAAACSACLLLGSNVFVPLRLSAPAPHAQGFAATHGRGEARQLAAASSLGGGAAAAPSGRLSALSAGLLLAGAAAAASVVRRGQATARRLTMQDVDSLTLEDIPKDFLWKLTIGRARRYVWVRQLRERLEQTQFLLAINVLSLPAKEHREIGEAFPPSVDRGVIRNAIMKKACEGTEWQGITDMFESKLYPPMMWFFVKKEEDVKESVKTWLAMEKKFKRVAVLEKAQDKMSVVTGRNALTVELKNSALCAMMRGDWSVIKPADIPKYKDLPTKLEVIAQIAGSIKQVPTKLARSTKQISQKIAIGTKKIVEKMEEQGKVKVADLMA